MPDVDDNERLAGRRVVLGVCGGIAAYKSAELLRLLKKSGADVTVVMTADAARFVTPLTLSTLSGRAVVTDLFASAEEGAWTRHIELGARADLLLIAPATANTIAKLATGLCDNMLTATVLAARCPVIVCPAMDHDMFLHRATQRNLETLREFGHEIVPPAFGSLASGLEGWGRMPEPAELLKRANSVIVRSGEAHAPASSRLAGKRVLVTAGPTREAIDPVRFLSNHSTGTMGFALAAEAARRGASVTLVTGPTHLQTPQGVDRIDVVSAADMYEAVQAHKNADVVIASAAVADYTPIETRSGKIKKTDPELVLPLRRTKDILAGIGAEARERQIRIGFALETEDEIEHARRKMRDKNLHWIVVNNPKTPGSGFGTGTNQVTLLGNGGERVELPVLPKQVLAAELLDRMIESTASDASE